MSSERLMYVQFTSCVYGGLLEVEIKSKQKRINILENDAQIVKEELLGEISVLDVSYICFLFLVANDKFVLHHDNVQKQNMQNLLKISSNNIFSDSHNSERVITEANLGLLQHPRWSVLWL